MVTCDLICLTDPGNPLRRLLGLVALLLAGAVLSAPTSAWGQETAEGSPVSSTPQVRTASVALGGTGGTYSLNFEQRATDHWAWRVGGGVYARVTPAVVTDEESIPSLLVGAPVGVRWLPGDGDWRLEVGLSVAPGAGREGSITPAVWGGPSVGVRHQPTGGGLFFRATVTATAAATPEAVRAGPGIGIELGYSF